MTSIHTLYWLTQTTADVPDDDAWLTEVESGILEKKHVPKRRSDWRLGRWTAKKAYAFYPVTTVSPTRFEDVEIRAAADGAPEVFVAGRRAAVTISISHSQGVCFCVISSQENAVGCDLEIVEPRSENLIADFFTPAERAVVLNQGETERHVLATLVWSAKESALKAMREGLRRDTRSVQVEVDLTSAREHWNPLAVKCVDSSRAFGGWWRRWGEYVQTVVTNNPEAEPVELVIP